jgi:ribosomal protein L37AE/L43A
MVRANMAGKIGIDELNPHQKRVAKERGEQKTAFGYCPTCRRYSWLKLNNRRWICNECGRPTEEV